MKSKKFENALREQISKAEEKYLDLHQMYEKVKVLSDGEEMDAQLSSLQRQTVSYLAIVCLLANNSAPRDTNIIFGIYIAISVYRMAQMFDGAKF